jgi:hypothetical protein
MEYGSRLHSFFQGKEAYSSLSNRLVSIGPSVGVEVTHTTQLLEQAPSPTRPCSRRTSSLEIINGGPGGHSARHTLVSILWCCDWAAQLSQGRLQSRNAGLEVLNFLFLVLAGPIHVRQRHDGTSRLLYLQADVVGGRCDVLDLERAIGGQLGGRGCRRWRLRRCLKEALEQLVEIGEDVKRRRRGDSWARGRGGRYGGGRSTCGRL